eukprot:3173517-Amphidinium_carterae.1
MSWGKVSVACTSHHKGRNGMSEGAGHVGPKGQGINAFFSFFAKATRAQTQKKATTHKLALRKLDNAVVQMHITTLDLTGNETYTVTRVISTDTSSNNQSVWNVHSVYYTRARMNPHLIPEAAESSDDSSTKKPRQGERLLNNEEIDAECGLCREAANLTNDDNQIVWWIMNQPCVDGGALQEKED